MGVGKTVLFLILVLIIIASSISIYRDVAHADVNVIKPFENTGFAVVGVSIKNNETKGEIKNEAG